ncbi:MAG: LysR family transcriptional regulator [Proteobacteria bacterium]|nr:LysR family transcriptional regulator [Pseudomonadota bacterium]
MLMLSRHLPSTRTLQCYLAVAQELNFRSAAELLNMSQPPLSRQIQGLEDLLRVQLIQRDTRQVSLTPAGEQFKREAHTFLLALDLAVQGMKVNFQDESEGPDIVRMGLTSVINYSLIPNLNMLISSPDFVRSRLERAYSKYLVERVRRGELDIAIVGDIIAPADDLSVELVGCDLTIVALPANHPAAEKQVLELSDLGDMPLFWFSRTDNPAFYDKCERVFKSYHYSAPRRLQAKDFAVLLAAIAAGEGITLCSASMQATSHVGVVYRALSAKLARQLAIDLHIVSRTQETRHQVLDKIQTIRSVLSSS